MSIPKITRQAEKKQSNKKVFLLILACTAVIASCKKDSDRFDILGSLKLQAAINYPSCKYHVSQINVVNGYAVQDSFDLIKLGNHSWYSYRDSTPTIVENKRTTTCVVASTLQMLILGRKNIDDNSLFAKKIKGELTDQTIAVLFAEMSQMAYKIYSGIYTDGIGLTEMGTMVNGNRNGYKGLISDWTDASVTQKADSPFECITIEEKTLVPEFITHSLDSGYVLSLGIFRNGSYDPLDSESLNRSYFISSSSSVGHEITIVNYAMYKGRIVVVYEDSMTSGERRCGFLDDILTSNLSHTSYSSVTLLRMRTR